MLFGFSDRLKVLSVLFLTLLFSGCAVFGGGNALDNAPTREEIVEKNCESKDKELVEDGALYVMASSDNPRMVTLYLVGRSGGQSVPIVRNLNMNQEVGPKKVRSLRQSDEVYLIFEHGNQSVPFGGSMTPTKIETHTGSRATLLDINVGSDGVEIFAHSSVVPYGIDCLDKQD